MRDFGFPLDPFQLEAIDAFERGESVLVAAPTGSGKTVVAEAAIDATIKAGGKVFYTAPIKALSNQKFVDLSEQFGQDKVGLLTGDNTIRGEAPVVVMTTEVLRNMIYENSSTLDELSVVVMDEVHYLQDAYRGPVWEEVIIGLAPDVRLVCLSATVSNSEELGAWLESVRGPTHTVVATERPIELEVLYGVTDRQERTDVVIPLFVDGEPNPLGAEFDTNQFISGGVRRPHRGGQGGRPREPRRYATPRRNRVAEYLADESLLPAIYFLFSRDGCDDASAFLRDSGTRLTSPEERTKIIEILERSVAQISEEDLTTLNYDLFAEGLGNGIAAHHAGMIPAFKEAVEQGFTAGLIKLVFATETLALGVNMPARSVVIEKLTKYNGETHRMLTPGEFTQLTGRAGRRGLDDAGSALVLWSPFVTFRESAALASSTRFPLISSFRPSYNMVANLARRYDHGGAVEVLDQSFAQFQSSRENRVLEDRLAQLMDNDSRLQELSRCEKGDVSQYVKLRNKAIGRARTQARDKAINDAIASLRPGDVIEPHLADDSALTGDAFAVLSSSQRARGRARARVVAPDGTLYRLTLEDLTAPPRSVSSLTIDESFSPVDDASIAEVAGELATYVAGIPAERPPQSDPNLARMEAHPVHSCPDAESHVEAFTMLDKSARDVRRARNRLLKKSNSITQRFDDITAILNDLDLLDSWTLTDSGRGLVRIYQENDLLIALAARDGLFDGLDGPSLAALTTAFIYEDRRPVPGRTAPIPTAELRRRIGSARKRAKSLIRLEQQRGLDETRMPDAGFVEAAYRWAKGSDLTEALDPAMTGGDFVRNIRVLADVLRQLSVVVEDPTTKEVARTVSGELLRGVVATAIGNSNT